MSTNLDFAVAKIRTASENESCFCSFPALFDIGAAVHCLKSIYITTIVTGYDMNFNQCFLNMQ